MNRPLAVAALVLATGGVAVGQASATFPGENGPIAFRTLDFDTGLGRPLFRARADGSGVTRLSTRPGFFSDWRADGRRVAFEFFQKDFDAQIAVARPDGSGVETLTSGPGIHELPSWSPDGRRIVYDYSPVRPDEKGFETHLWTMGADGSGARTLPVRPGGFDVEPRWSPDGKQIAFMRLRLKPRFHQAVFVVSAKGGKVQRLTPWHQDAEHPTWSPDGRRLLFNLSPAGSVISMRPNGGDRRVVLRARAGLGGHKPVYSPDGTRILFMCESQGTLRKPPPDFNEDLCTMNADGTGMVNITNTPKRFENWPSWGAAR